MRRGERDPTAAGSSMAKQSRGSIADTLASARASLKNPSRPFTPADPLRRLHGSSLASPSAPRPPPTPLVNINSSFEAERPFTSLLGTAPLPTKPSRPSTRGANSEGSRGGGAQILSLDEGETSTLHGAGPSFTGGRAKSRDDEDDLWEQIRGLLPALVVPNGVAGMASVCNCCDRLNDLLKESSAVKRLSTSQRSEIVRAAAKVLDVKDAQLLAKLGSLILRITKGGANLLSVSKLVFRLSKTPANDEILQQEGLCLGILGSLGHSRLQSIISGLETVGSGPSDLEACVYLWGALKNTSTDSLGNQTQLLDNGAFSIISAWMRALSKIRHGVTSVEDAAAQAKLREQITDLLVQTTSVFRNLTSSPAMQDQLAESGAVEALCDMLKESSDSGELILHISRVLSKVSVHSAYRGQLLTGSVPESLINAIKRHKTDVPLLVRSFFVLGNLTAAEERHRADLARLRDGVDILMDILSTNTQILLQNEDASSRNNKLDQSVEQVADLLVKLVRLIAHLAISPTVGPQLSCHPSIESLIMLLEGMEMSKCEELILNVVSALTNLSYYDVDDSVIWRCRAAIAQGLAPMLFQENDEAVLEAARAFGNLSRDDDTRGVMHTTRVDEAMVLLLDHAQKDVVAAVAGVLVNLSADRKCAGTIVHTDGLGALLDTIERTGTGDAELTTTLCHAMFNLCCTVEWQLEDAHSNVLLALAEELLDQAQDMQANQGDNAALEALSDVLRRLHESVMKHCIDDDGNIDGLDGLDLDNSEESYLEPLQGPPDEHA